MWLEVVEWSCQTRGVWISLGGRVQQGPSVRFQHVFQCSAKAWSGACYKRQGAISSRQLRKTCSPRLSTPFPLLFFPNIRHTNRNKMPCTECGGTGEVAGYRCTKCNGNGRRPTILNRHSETCTQVGSGLPCLQMRTAGVLNPSKRLLNSRPLCGAAVAALVALDACWLMAK